MSAKPKIRLYNCLPEQRQELRAAMEFYMETHLGPKLSRNICANVTFVHGLRRNERRRGDVCWAKYDTERRPRTFRMRIDADIGLRSKLFVIAHEVAHIKQFARGELKGLGTTRTLWHGHRVASQSLSYWDYPWEIEARGMELSLYVKWRRHKKNLKVHNS